MSKDTGVFRIHMRSGTGDWVTAYLPLGTDGRVNIKGAQPFLLKALWDAAVYYGELNPEKGKHHRIQWDSGPDSFTDLGTVPVGSGRLVQISETDDPNADWREFVIHEVTRM